MKKIIFIEGMTCGHCANHVKEALQKLEGILEVKVDLGEKKAEIVLNKEIDNHQLVELIMEEGYHVKKIQEI